MSEQTAAAQRADTGNIQERLIAPCAAVDAKGSVFADIPALLNRLLIFETYYLQSVRLREFNSLVRTLGLENVVLLLDSGALKIDLNPTQFGQTGQTAPQLGIREKPSLPLLSYSFSLLRTPLRNDYLVRSVQGLHRELGDVLSRKDLMVLDGAILRAVMPVPENSGVSALLAFDADLKSNARIFKKALLSQLRLRPGFENIEEPAVSLVVRKIDETDFETESNLESLGLAKEDAHKILESALLGAGYVNRRIEDMENYGALSGAIDGELPMFEEKFNFLAKTLSPKQQEKNFDRVLRIGRFPCFEFSPPTQQFDMERFLKIRESDECVSFRDWLRRAAFQDQQEIYAQVGSVRARLGVFVHGTTGKLIRFAVNGAAGLLPITGLALGAIDAFVLEKILPVSGPAMFLDALYGSLFSRNTEVQSDTEGRGRFK